MANTLRLKNSSPGAFLPFSATVEAEALGFAITADAPPRRMVYPGNGLEALGKLHAIDFSQGQISRVLAACRLIKAQKLPVMLEMQGPLTIAAYGVDFGPFFSLWGRDAAIDAFFSLAMAELLKYAAKAKEAGVAILSYGDFLASLDILGPKYGQWFYQRFLKEFFNRLAVLAGDEFIVHLCPKTADFCLKIGVGGFKNYWPKGDSYLENCLSLRGNAGLVYGACLKNATPFTKGAKIKELLL